MNTCYSELLRNVYITPSWKKRIIGMHKKILYFQKNTFPGSVVLKRYLLQLRKTWKELQQIEKNPINSFHMTNFLEQGNANQCFHFPKTWVFKCIIGALNADCYYLRRLHITLKTCTLHLFLFCLSKETGFFRIQCFISRNTAIELKRFPGSGNKLHRSTHNRHFI